MSCQLQKVPIIGIIKLEEDFKVVFFRTIWVAKKAHKLKWNTSYPNKNALY